jgi:hypothetical protein
MVVTIDAGSPGQAVQCLQNILDRPAVYNLVTGYPLQPVRVSISGGERKMSIIMRTGLRDTKRTVRIVLRDISVGYEGSDGAASAAAILVMLGVGKEWRTLYNVLTTPSRGRNNADSWKSYYKFDLNP